jgi:hypothetical protein
VGLQDAPAHGPRPGAPGRHRQVLGAASEPPRAKRCPCGVMGPTSHQPPVVLGAWGVPGVLNLVYKQQKTPTAHNGGRVTAVWTMRAYSPASPPEGWGGSSESLVFEPKASAMAQEPALCPKSPSTACSLVCGGGGVGVAIDAPAP